MSLPKVVIGGATGYIGSRLTELLTKQGFETITVSRNKKKADMRWEDIESYGLPNDLHAAINLAGVNVFSKLWTKGFKQEIRDSRIGTTKILAKAIVNTKAESFITISGVGYYTPDPQQTYDENSQCEPYDFFSQLCHDWEAAAKLPAESTIRQVIIRSGVVLGKGSAIDQNMRRIFKLYLGGPIGSGSQFMPWIHVNDLVNLFLFSLKNKNVTGILNGVAPEVATNQQFTKEYAKALGVFALIPVPSFMTQLMFHKERAIMLLEGPKVLPKKPMDLGFTYQHSTISNACQEMM